MKTITLTDKQFDNLFYYLDEKVNQIVDTSVEYQDDEERALIEGIEAQIYDVKEEDLLRVMNILKAQEKQPKAEWQYDS